MLDACFAGRSSEGGAASFAAGLVPAAGWEGLGGVSVVLVCKCHFRSRAWAACFEQATRVWVVAQVYSTAEASLMQMSSLQEQVYTQKPVAISNMFSCERLMPVVSCRCVFRLDLC